MSPSTIILVILMVSDTSSLLILDKLAQLKDKIVEKVLGDDNCGCPCREYSVVKCDVEWVEHCYQEHYHTKCEKRQAFKTRMVSSGSILHSYPILYLLSVFVCLCVFAIPLVCKIFKSMIF